MVSTYILLAISIRVALVAVVCLGVGGALAVLTWWFWSTAMPEPPSLARLEIMSDRRFEEATSEEREQLLKEADGIVAVPLKRKIVRNEPARKQHVRQEDEMVDQPAPGRRVIDPLLK